MNMEKKYENELVIEINQQLVDEYNAEYFKKYKNRRKPAIDSPLPLSLNKILVMRRPQMNDTKQKYKDFMIWVCEKQGINNLRISDCEIYLEFVVHNRAKKDLDNYIGGWKMFSDGMTVKDGAGVIEDDNFFVVKKLSSTIRYEKGIKKTIVHIYHN